MIVFDYNKAMGLVLELRQIAAELNNIKNGDLANAISGVQGGWQGNTSERFLGKCDELYDLIANEIININNVANSLERTSNDIDRTEREAADAFKHFITGGIL